MKPVRFAVGIAAVLVLVLGLASTGDAAPIRLKMSATQPPTHPNCLAVKHIKALLDKKAPGRFNAQAICGLSLGSDVEVARQVRLGLLQFATNSSANMSNISPPFAILDIPFMFQNPKQAETVLAGSFGKKLMELLPSKGVRGMAFIPGGFRQIFNSKRAVKVRTDMKGLKLRTARSKTDLAAAKFIGAAPTPLAFGEVYSALQQGVVEGVLIPSLLGYGMKFHEVAPHLAIIDLQAITFIWFVNNSWYKNLPSDMRKVFQESVNEARKFYKEENNRQNGQVFKKLAAEGAKITRISADVKKPLIDAAKKGWDQFKGPIPAEYFTEIEKAKAAAGS